MKKIVILLMMCAISLTAAAQGWQYRNNKGILESSPLYLSGDYDSPTVLSIMVGNNQHVGDMVLCCLFGDGLCDFRSSQQYVIFNYCDGEIKVGIQEVTIEGNQFRAFVLDDAARMIGLFRDLDWFTISLPIHKHGVQTFTFSAEGYPLDW